VDGIAVIAWDMPSHPLNVINPEVSSEFGKIVDRISSDSANGRAHCRVRTTLNAINDRRFGVDRKTFM
jgi:hypothetical protein